MSATGRSARDERGVRPHRGTPAIFTWSQLWTDEGQGAARRAALTIRREETLMNRRRALAVLSTAAASPLALGLPAPRARPGHGGRDPHLRAERRLTALDPAQGSFATYPAGYEVALLPLRSAGRLRREPEVRPSARRELGHRDRSQVHQVSAPEERAVPRRRRVQRPVGEVQRRADGGQDPHSHQPAAVGSRRGSRRGGRAHGGHSHQGGRTRSSSIRSPTGPGPWSRRMPSRSTARRVSRRTRSARDRTGSSRSIRASR